MGDELKAYFPSLVHPVLRLFLQDKSPQRVATQKVGQVEERGQGRRVGEGRVGEGRGGEGRGGEGRGGEGRGEVGSDSPCVCLPRC